MEWLRISTSVELVRVATDYSFYRSADGKKHDIGNPADYPHKKWKGIIPWLVFRKI